ncbi:MAG: aldehyde dehydrogenase family protein [Candidatus Competibacteraceae bacterium]|nr:aldehyde dehydrogenase family protein [Candidatus Competibacteraceae bacterium]
MTDIQKTISPVDDSVYVERTRATAQQIDATLSKAAAAQADWKRLSISERADYCSRFTDAFVAKRNPIAEEISWQMGRPISAAPGEVRGLEERARHMIALADTALADIAVDEKSGFTRFIRREPLGVVLTVAPWNYPYLTAVNSIIPALMAGNTVVLKHSAQTPLCAERFLHCFREAGLPEGVFQILHMDHAGVEQAIKSPHTAYVAFTGSVAGGHAVQAAAAGRFIATGLELGGKDPAYVREDVTLEHAIENLVDGAMFNSGQSCCGIERIYVHQSIFQRFVDGFVDLTRQYRLGNPLDLDTNLGPMVRVQAAEFVRGQVADAVSAGAQALIDPKTFPADQPGTPYLAPQVLVKVDHSMRIMHEETFGPAIGIMAVDSDEQAIQLMNDSDYGLTASIWTNDADAALRIGDAVNTGTWFMNRCDYLDPALAWVGVKDSGRGCTLSQVGYEYLTRPKSFHLRTVL